VNESLIDGLQVSWTDTLGAMNSKSSYFDEGLNVNHEAHVEAPEEGAHRIAIPAQPGCNVGYVYVNGVRQPEPGPQQVTVSFPKTTKALTIFVDVQCVR
jgi:hypothetical protein